MIKLPLDCNITTKIKPTKHMTSQIENLQTKISNNKHVIGVIGLGYVGLPLINAICSNSIKAIGFDVDPEKIEHIERGKSYIGGVSDESLQRHTTQKLFSATTDFQKLQNVDVIIICVPTPLDEKEQPDLSYIEKTTQEIASNLVDGQLIILESTTYPGTVESIMEPILSVTQKQYYLAYSPEREDPGNADFATSSTPKIIGADEEGVLQVTTELYSQFIEKVVPVNSIKVAEAAKITENVFRAVNIALVNELKVIFDKMDIDVWEVIEAAKTKPFGYMPFYPGPGIGGHCIPIDPIYLAWKANQVGSKTEFIELAAKINQSMPAFIIRKLMEALSLSKPQDFKNKNFLILGIAYKKNVSDQRETPAFPLMKELNEYGANIEFYDPHIPQILKNRAYPEFTGLKSIVLTEEELTKFDAAIVVTDHDNIDYSLIENKIGVIIDTRNIYENSKNNIIKA
jgi:UDP-N-acetyl-D-glucosamine dehydrogenase